MSSLSLNKVYDNQCKIFFYKSHEDWKCKKKEKKKGTIKECIFEFPCTDDFFNCIIYLTTVGLFFLNSLKIIFLGAIFIGLLTKICNI